MFFTSTIQEAAFKERIALNNLEVLYNPFPNEVYFKTITRFDGNDFYDALYQKHKEGTTEKRYYIEIKIRDKVFPDYFIEPKKIKDIEGVALQNLSKCEFEILYLNFTPEGTFLWNATNLINNNKYKLEKKWANKCTMKSRTDKIEKDFWAFEKGDAKFFNYIWDDNQMKPHLNNYFQPKNEIQKKRGIGFQL